MHPTDVAAPGGVFGRLGNVAVRWPLLIIGRWIALAAVLALAFPSMAEVAAQNLPEILPANAPVVATSGQSGDSHDPVADLHRTAPISRAAPARSLATTLRAASGQQRGARNRDGRCDGQPKQSTPDVLETRCLVTWRKTTNSLPRNDRKRWTLWPW
jgi:hypothetical protein